MNGLKSLYFVLILAVLRASGFAQEALIPEQVHDQTMVKIFVSQTERVGGVFGIAGQLGIQRAGVLLNGGDHVVDCLGQANVKVSFGFNGDALRRGPDKATAGKFFMTVSGANAVLPESIRLQKQVALALCCHYVGDRLSFLRQAKKNGLVNKGRSRASLVTLLHVYKVGKRLRSSLDLPASSLQAYLPEKLEL